MCNTPGMPSEGSSIKHPACAWRTHNAAAHSPGIAASPNGCNVRERASSPRDEPRKSQIDRSHGRPTGQLHGQAENSGRKGSRESESASGRPCPYETQTTAAVLLYCCRGVNAHLDSGAIGRLPVLHQSLLPLRPLLGAFGCPFPSLLLPAGPPTQAQQPRRSRRRLHAAGQGWRRGGVPEELARRREGGRLKPAQGGGAGLAERRGEGEGEDGRARAGAHRQQALAVDAGGVVGGDARGRGLARDAPRRRRRDFDAAAAAAAGAAAACGDRSGAGRGGDAAEGAAAPADARATAIVALFREARGGPSRCGGGCRVERGWHISLFDHRGRVDVGIGGRGLRQRAEIDVFRSDGRATAVIPDVDSRRKTPVLPLVLVLALLVLLLDVLEEVVEVHIIEIFFPPIQPTASTQRERRQRGRLHVQGRREQSEATERECVEGGRNLKFV